MIPYPQLLESHFIEFDVKSKKKKCLKQHHTHEKTPVSNNPTKNAALVDIL